MHTHVQPDPHWRTRPWDASGGQGPKFIVSGKTEDGVRIIRGTFPFVNSIGLPLDVVVEYLRDHGCMMDWIDFYLESLKCDWPPERTFDRLRQVIGEVYGPQFRKGWEVKMREVMRIERECQVQDPTT